jgi:hypothetical protein
MAFFVASYARLSQGNLNQPDVAKKMAFIMNKL